MGTTSTNLLSLKRLGQRMVGPLQDVLWRLPGDELVAAVAAFPLTHEVVFLAFVKGVDHTGEPAALGAAGSQAVLHGGWLTNEL